MPRDTCVCTQAYSHMHRRMHTDTQRSRFLWLSASHPTYLLLFLPQPPSPLPPNREGG